MPPYETQCIRVGMPISLTGMFKTQGNQALSGVMAWVQDVNESGGIYVGDIGSRLPLSLHYYDDESQVTSARLATLKLIRDDKVDLLFGPYSSALSLGAAEVANEHARILWNHGGASDSIYEKGYRYVVGILTSARDYLEGLPDVVRDSLPRASTFAILNSNKGSFPRMISEGARTTLTVNGFREVFCGHYDPESVDFSNLLRDVSKLHPDILIGVGRIENDLLLAKQIIEQNVKKHIRIAVLVAAGIEEFGESLSSQSEGFLGPTQWDKDVMVRTDCGPTFAQVTDSLARYCDGPVDYPMVQAYAAGVVVKNCVEVAGTLDQENLRAVALRSDISTFFGRFKVDPDTGRQIGRSVQLVQWQSDRKVLVWPYGPTSKPVRPWIHSQKELL